ncbi:MAG: hypothetical protein COW30_05275 [Rhodospirillales bacterium CG15_BIG_FIL_POST_REV_8_21_14_020_66_15]|nr:MAG: hypothetical protein COW30_05275 [Rhodospirillales bacterium CG15_BIG_FIL_POST_REV_8_21_14_020_66_15]
MFRNVNRVTLSARSIISSVGAIALASVIAGSQSPAAAAEIDWSKVPAKTVKLFYPGQSAYSWLASSAHKRADKKVLAGDACVSCHEGEEADIGNLIVSGKKLEPNPIPGKEGVKDLSVQAAHDDTNLYLRFEWKSQADREGRMHNMIRFDGKEWKWYGSHRASKAVREGKTPPVYEDRLAIMVDDGRVPNFAKQGCWLTCHDGMRDMPKEAKGDIVKGHAYLGGVKKQSDVRKYLPASRTDAAASWDKTKTPEEIAKIQEAGGFLDLMQWRVARSNPVGMADDGYVLEYRNFDAGKKMFSWNVDKKTMTPKFMFDKSKTGYTALREADFTDPSKSTAIIKEANAKPYDPAAGFKEGDILPGRLLTAKTEGSAGDNDSAKGTWKDGTYTLVFRRKLDTGHPLDDKILKVGGVYTIGLAIHDDNVTTRFHHVSFPLSLGIGAKADITAVSLK